MSEPKALTTGQIARYCNVSQATIINWIRKGKLKAYATPGGHHRVLLPDLLSFLEIYNMPMHSALDALTRPRVLIVSESPRAPALAQSLKRDGRFEAALAGNAHEAGAQVAQLNPDVVILDLSSPTLNWTALCQWLRASPAGEAPFILAIGDPEREEDARVAGADAYLAYSATCDEIPTLCSQIELLLAGNKTTRKRSYRAAHEKPPRSQPKP